MLSEVTVVTGPARLTLVELASKVRAHLEAVDAERAMVFGSYARGTADAFSDLDLVVVMATDLPQSDRWRVLGPLLDALPVAVDLLVYTPEEFRRGSERAADVFDALSREGITIYERSPA